MIDPLDGIDFPDDDAPAIGERLPRCMNVTDLAARVGRPRSYVTNTLKAAGMRRTNGKFLTAKALEILAAVADPATTIAKAAHGHSSPTGATLDPRIASFAEARARSEGLRADKLKQALDREAGLLIPRDDVALLAKRIAVATREAVLAVPAKIAAVCAGKEPDAIQHLMHEALSAAMRALAGDFLTPMAAK